MTEKVLDTDPDYNETMWTRANEAWTKISKFVGFESREVAFKTGYGMAVKEYDEIIRSAYEAGYQKAFELNRNQEDDL